MNLVDVRLYSKSSIQKPLPEDAIATQHMELHNELGRWGLWNRVVWSQSTCASAEKGFEKGGRDATPASTAPQPPNPKILAIDTAWRLMKRRVPQHALCIWLYYVERNDLTLICRKLKLHWSSFGWFMNHSRSMVRNLMRELDI